MGGIDGDGEPKCPDACSRLHQRDRDVKDYSWFPGGEANHFDGVFWLSDRDFGAAGHGGDWGQRLVRGLVTENATAEHLSVELHELGHGLGFPDFYHGPDQGLEPIGINQASPRVLADLVNVDVVAHGTSFTTTTASTRRSLVDAHGLEPPPSVMWYRERVTGWERWMLRRIWDEVKAARHP